jgi:hypothetical protein
MHILDHRQPVDCYRRTHPAFISEVEEELAFTAQD